MSNDDNDDVSRSGGRDRVEKSGDHAARVKVVRGSDRRRLDRAAYADDVTLLGRRQMAEAREDAAHQRESAAGQREEVVQAREGEARLRERRAVTREEEMNFTR
ncbi:hypothetical protein [Kineobactrum salinum]|uniref:Uncharacterized protein n=1 Tax=Kineobactrum salinum TaxID=2708301 RepID=A0A6C0U7F7_9GAMM|nr:hypothetical protein [Kineobactrum salinum]QIB66907.1 hypothetical protein G3T16_17435 [Kineobactrum salinum]